MNPLLGWALAALLLASAWQSYGWQGAAFAATLIVFWLLLQFSRALRVMRNAADKPIGHVDSAVMLQARLKRGMTMLDLVKLTRSLGRKVADAPETWVWSDDSGASVRLVLTNGKLDQWQLDRTE